MEAKTEDSGEVIEVEVERLPVEEEEPPAAEAARRVKRALSPILAGLMIDMLDVGTFGPIGLKLGLLVGAAAGYWLAGQLGFRGKSRFMVALGAGLYCFFPGTHVLPLGTLLGALSRFLYEDPRKTEG